ncbi:polysaccharide deacetylase family protein [Polaribacter aestuariivivens]|uniref:Polysaccharide deacetylase family protein n=1 Tax=Polaribacter aestuariivivens TaxID=2304626 RepID=A0A5S3N3S2_9FLAO|nr:polysaccharide deacetylase family protein [Polaribacter aestuariivivens]TMM29981.1 polysaccharide deacetylase family protein [Polaribacter aestuariivivens]
MRFFSEYIWRFSLKKKEIYLTFDDGPTPEITEFVLSELQKHNAKATFFCIGKNIENHPAIFKKIIDGEHSIGNHTQNHLNGWKSNKTVYINDFLECKNVISSKVEKPHNSKLFRPPYGKIKKNQAKQILKKGYKIIMWSVLSADFDATISKEKCLQNVLKNTKNGSIIVFHDSIKAAEKIRFVLPKVLETFSKKGFKFKAID